MNRRKFFAMLPAAPVAIATWPTEAKAAPEDAPRAGETMITIQGTKPPKPINTPYSISIMPFADPDPNKQVSMAVGNDGNLWLKKANGDWKRVVTE